MIYKETVTERLGGCIAASNVTQVEPADLETAKAHYAETRSCRHEFVSDVAGWLYDFRECRICGSGLGAV